MSAGKRDTDDKAVASLYSGSAGSSCPPVLSPPVTIVLSVPAIVFALMACGDIAADSTLRGRRLTTAGLLTGVVGTLIGAAAFVVVGLET